MAQVDTCANTGLVFLKLQFHRYEVHSPPLLRVHGFSALVGVPFKVDAAVWSPDQRQFFRLILPVIL